MQWVVAFQTIYLSLYVRYVIFVLTHQTTIQAEDMYEAAA